MKRALILGITGMDGSYLAEILLQRGVQVHGFYRRSSTGNFKNIEHIKDQIRFHRGDLLDSESIRDAIIDSHPDELYNLADQDNVDWSYTVPHYSLEATAGGVLNVLEAVRKIKKDVKVFQPVSATMFGDASSPQNESTLLNPLSPYACFKAASYYLARYYRQCRGMYVNCGIMFNHDSPRRSEEYLLHKIAAGAVRIKQGKYSRLSLYGLGDHVDIGYAPEYMNVVVDSMQRDEPFDFCVCTSRSYTIRALAMSALMQVGFDWDLAAGKIEEGNCNQRPGPRQELLGSIDNKSRQLLGFYPKHDAMSLMSMLVDHYMEKLK